MAQRENPDPKAGDQLRDRAADFLASKYGPAKTEYREAGKKIDVYFEHKDLGRTAKIFVEGKDYNRPLRREEVVIIWSDYSGIIQRNSPAVLLIVTRSGLTSDARSFIENEQTQCRHQTIWEI